MGDNGSVDRMMRKLRAEIYRRSEIKYTGTIVIRMSMRDGGVAGAYLVKEEGWDILSGSGKTRLAGTKDD